VNWKEIGRRHILIREAYPDIDNIKMDLFHKLFKLQSVEMQDDSQIVNWKQIGRRHILITEAYPNIDNIKIDVQEVGFGDMD
jgi:hypothetical protein